MLVNQYILKRKERFMFRIEFSDEKYRIVEHPNGQFKTRRDAMEATMIVVHRCIKVESHTTSALEKGSRYEESKALMEKYKKKNTKAAKSHPGRRW
jgi:hypothetical protein